MFRWVTYQIEAPVKKPMPFLTYPSVQHLGLSVRETLASSENQAMAMELISKKTNMAAAFNFMDLSVEAQCFGASIIEAENIAPYIKQKTITSINEVKKLQVPLVNSGRASVYLKAVNLASKSIIDRPIFAHLTAPFTITGILLGVKEIYDLCTTNPMLVQHVIHMTTAFLIDYCRAYKNMGIQGVVLCDPLAGQLQSHLVEEFSLKYIRSLIIELQQQDFIFIYHNCGNNIPYCIDKIVNTEALGYSFGNNINLAEIAAYIPKHVLMLGILILMEQFVMEAVKR